MSSKKNKKKEEASVSEEEQVTAPAVEEEEEEAEYRTSASAADLLNDVIEDEKKEKESSKKAEPADEEDGEDDDEPKKKKPKSEHKKLKHGAMSTVYTVIFVAAVVLVNIVATILFDKYPIKLDLTKNSKYSISEQSEEYVKSITEDVTIKIFAKEDEFIAVNDYTNQANEVLKRYSEYNSHIKIEYIDIDSNPNIVSEYTDQEISNYSILVETLSRDENGNVIKNDDGTELKRIRTVSLLDLISFTDDFEQQVQGYGMSAEDFMLANAGGDEATAFAYAVYYNYVEASTADEAFISALMAVTDPDPVVVSVLTGRDETADIGYLKKLLLANGYTVNDVDITSEEIPADTDLCIIAAPATDYMETEIAKVDEFINNDGKMGKNLLYLASIKQSATPNLDELLEEYYIQIGNGAVFETDQKYYTYSASGQVYTIADDIADSFADEIDTDSAQLLLQYSRPITLMKDEMGKQTMEAYVSSTENACVMDMDTGEVSENGKQIYAAMSSKASFEEGGTANYSNIFVIGSAEMLSDQFLMFSQFQNRSYILSVLNGMTGKTNTGITVEPKVISGNIFDITAEKIKTLKIIFIGVIPAATLALGLVIWLRRKNR